MFNKAGQLNLLREAAKEFADLAVSNVGEAVDAIVLYGSVARGDIWEESDIDILVIGSDLRTIPKRLSQIADEQAYENGYAFWLSTVEFSREHFLELERIGAPFILNVLDDGVALYDTGIFSRVRGESS